VQPEQAALPVNALAAWLRDVSGEGECLNALPTTYTQTHYKCTRFGGTYTKIGTIQRRLAWPLRKDDTQIREAFHIFNHEVFSCIFIFMYKTYYVKQCFLLVQFCNMQLFFHLALFKI